MPSTSKDQQTAARIALAVKKGKIPAKPGMPSTKMAKGMNQKQLKDFTRRKQ